MMVIQNAPRLANLASSSMLTSAEAFERERDGMTDFGGRGKHDTVAAASKTNAGCF